MLKALQDAYARELKEKQCFEIPFGTKHHTLNGVFLWLFCRDIAPYLGLTNSINAIPAIFCIARWDGLFGAIGGKIDGDEPLESALHREALEEVGLNLRDLNDGYKQLVSFNSLDYHSHVYACEVCAQQLYEIRDKACAINAKSKECCGYNIVHATKYRSTARNKQNGLESFLAQQFAGVSKAGLLKLIVEHQLFTEQDIIY